MRTEPLRAGSPCFEFGDKRIHFLQVIVDIFAEQKLRTRIYGREFMAALGPRNRLNCAAPGLCLDATQIADIISYWQ
jgi:hypothetical protein